MAYYITWTTTDRTFDHWEYVGGGVTAPRFSEPKTFTHRVRWSTEETPERKAQAEQYIKTDMADRENVKLISIPD